MDPMEALILDSFIFFFFFFMVFDPNVNSP
jgi:hypothetical protein